MKNPLATILKKRGIKQAILAKELGITPSFLSHILAGRRRFGVDTAIRVSQLTGIPIERFYR